MKCSTRKMSNTHGRSGCRDLSNERNITCPLRAFSCLSPRTANYVAALIREGDRFDYCRWLQGVRAEEAQAKLRPQTTLTSGRLGCAEIGPSNRYT